MYSLDAVAVIRCTFFAEKFVYMKYKQYLCTEFNTYSYGTRNNK